MVLGFRGDGEDRKIETTLWSEVCLFCPSRSICPEHLLQGNNLASRRMDTSVRVLVQFFFWFHMNTCLLFSARLPKELSKLCVCVRE